MATQVQSLFGITPESYQAQQQAALDAQALQFAKLTPMQQAQMGLFRGASQLGTGLAGLMGYQDPEMQRIKARQGLLGGIDMSDPAALREAAKSADPEMAQQLISEANKLELAAAQTARQTTLAEKDKAELGRIVTEQQREEQLRTALNELPENATPEQYLAVVRKFGSPDKVMTSIQTSLDREEQRRQALQLKQMEIERRLEEARIRGEQAQELERLRIEGRRELAQFAAALRDSQASQKPEKPMPASLQKAEDADFEAIDAYSNVNATLDPVLTSLGGTGMRPENPTLNLGAMRNAMSNVRNFFGASTPESRQYAQLEEAKTRLINESLRLNKGVQTEGDAQRAAKEVEAAWARNDTEATRLALLRLKEVNDRAIKNKEAQIDRRRESQGKEAYFTNVPQPSGTDQGGWGIRRK